MKIIFLFLLALALASVPAAAHCPLCTGAVVAGAVGAKYLGLDVTIIGIFSGAFAISLGLWIGRKIRRFIPFQTAILVIASFLLTILPAMPLIKDTVYVPILLAGEPGTLLNQIYFVNKLLLGSIIGGIATLLAYWLHVFVKKQRGKVMFPFQGIAFTVGALVIASMVTYLVM